MLQLTRVGFLLLLWLFIWSVLRILRTDIYAPTGAVMVRRGWLSVARFYRVGTDAISRGNWWSPRAH